MIINAPKIKWKTARGKNALAGRGGVKIIRVHDFRHSRAALLINQGKNIVAVSKRSGHSDVHITLKIYTHLIEKKITNLLTKSSQNLLKKGSEQKKTA